MEQLQSPLINKFVAHWRGLCRDGQIPTTEDYMDRADPMTAQFLMMFDVLPDDVIVRFQGMAIGDRRKLEQTGLSWFARNSHLNAANVTANIWEALRTPCGIWTEANFVTSVQRRLRVEALSLPLRAREGRPPRWLNISVGLDTMDFDERAMGWHGDIKIGWYDAGYGVPNTAVLPVS